MCQPISQDAACDSFQNWNRRRVLKAATSLASAGWLTQFAEQLSRGSESGRAQPKSLLFLWMQGGPSQLETFDPQPGTWIGGATKAIPTSIPQISISDTLPATAEQLKHATLVRSVVSKEGDHERASYHLKTGWRPDPTIVHPAIGSVVCYQSQANLEIPRHVSIIPSQWPARGGYLGPSLDAFQINDPADGIPNLKPRVDEETLGRRSTTLLNTLEAEFQRGRLANMEHTRTLHQSATQAALRMMTSQQLSAFDVHSEGAETLARFGDSPFARGCLAAVRLLATGVRCVEVELNGWDSHINNQELQAGQAHILDSALAATLQELQARDLLDDTIVFCGGEFGRTPVINPAGGRDHWPHGFSVLLAGGGFRKGYVHGSTNGNPDRKWFERKDTQLDSTLFADKAVTVPDLHATMLHALGIDHEHESMTPIGRPLRWSDGNVVSELLSEA